MNLKVFLFPLIGFSLSFLDTCALETKQKVAGPSDLVFEVQTIKPRLQEMPREIFAEGIFEASEKVTVIAEVGGLVEKMMVNEGDMVNFGDPLCQLKTEDLKSFYDQKVQEAKETEEAIDRLRFIAQAPGPYVPEADQPKAENQEPLFLDEEARDKPIPKPTGDPDLEEKPVAEATPKPDQADIRVLEARKERLDRELDDIQKRLELLTVKAPIAGMVRKSYINEGAQAASKNPVFDLVNLNPVTLVFHIPKEISSYVDKMVGVKVHPISAPDIITEASVFFISPSIDPVKKALEMRVHIPNDRGLIKEGLEGRAVITTRKVDKLVVVPKHAVVDGPSGQVVYALAGPRAKLVPVQVKKEMGDELVIDGNLRVDDEIITTLNPQLADGSFVKKKQSNEMKKESPPETKPVIPPPLSPPPKKTQPSKS